MKELSPGSGPVKSGRLIVGIGYVQKAGQKDKHPVAKAGPHNDSIQHPRHCGGGTDPVGGRGKTDETENRIDKPNLGLQEVFPDQTDHNGGTNGGNKIYEPEYIFEGQFPNNQRRPIGEYETTKNSPKGVGKIVRHCPVKQIIFYYVDVIGKSKECSALQGSPFLKAYYK
jgi:hypothetical protein